MLDFVKEMIVKCHTASYEAGWWNDAPKKPRELAKYLGLKVALIHSEISEMWEASPLGKDHHVTLYSNWEVERADIFIRSCDLLGFLISHHSLPGVDNRSEFKVRFPKVVSGFVGELLAGRELYQIAVGKDEGWAGGILMEFHREASRILEAVRFMNMRLVKLHTLILAISVATADKLSEESEPDPFKKVVRDKLAYNSERLDHKTENREKTGGKIF